jgi:malate dehydrogenase (oxaloacetate-decarboxylating)(NADP+)
LGVRKENILVFDSKGVIHTKRTDLDATKTEFVRNVEPMSLEEALVGADMFLGLSKGNVLQPEWLKKMADKPIVFALANPDPEIAYEVAIAARPDLIMATGRSDYPNQVNNVLGFPFIFRGALDVRATAINEEMKLAAVYALAELTKEPVHETVKLAYNDKQMTFGPKYIIPKPLDPRLLTRIAPAVAKAAMDSGVARNPITDWHEYERSLVERLGYDQSMIRRLGSKARQEPQRVVFAEADNPKVLQAAQIAFEDGIAKPILLGDRNKILRQIHANNMDLGDCPIIDPRSEDATELRMRYAAAFYEKRKRRGYNFYEAQKIMLERNYFGCMMVEKGDADVFISGLTRKYSATIKPALEIIGTYRENKKVSGIYLMLTKKGPIFFADCTVIQNPTSNELADIAATTARMAKEFGVEPRIAFLSYSNFGSSDDPEPRAVREAVSLLKKRYPDLVADGEIQANVAFNQEILSENYPFSELVNGNPNILIFPNLAAGNIAYKLLQVMESAEAIGPIITGLKKSVHVLQLGSSVREIVNMVTIAVVDAQLKKRISSSYV